VNIGEFLTLLAPELILLIGATVVLLLGLMRSAGGNSLVSGVSLGVVVLAAIVAVRLGVPDGTAAALGLWLTPLVYFTRCVTLGIGALIVLVNWHQPAARERGEYMAMILLSLLGVLITASANDLLVLLFAIELVSVPTYVLVALSREDRRASEASVKYFFLGALSAAILAYGISFLYGVAGTTTIHALNGAQAISAMPSGDALDGLALIGLLLVIAALAFKIAAVPCHAYIPDVYEGAASPITGMLGFVPKMAGFVALLKIFTACNWDLPTEVLWVLWFLSAASMTAGNVLALLQKNVKRMLAYSSIAHTGYMMIALLVGPVAGRGPLHDGLAALLFYVTVYGVMNLGAFALLTAFRDRDRPVETLDDIAGLAVQAPRASFGLAVCVFSLMGLPPTAGFLAKVYVFSSAFSVPRPHPFHGPLIALAIIGVANAAIGAAYYLRIAASAYAGSADRPRIPAGGTPVRLGLALCAVLMLVFFAWPAGIVRQAHLASAQLEDTFKGHSRRLATPADESHLPHSKGPGRSAVPVSHNAVDD